MILKLLCFLVILFEIKAHVIPISQLQNQTSCQLSSLRFCELQKDILFMIYDSENKSFKNRQFKYLTEYLDEQLTLSRQRSGSISIPYLVLADCFVSPSQCQFFEPQQLPIIILLQKSKNAFKYKGFPTSIELKSFISLHNPETSSNVEEYNLFEFKLPSSGGLFSFFSSFKDLFTVQMQKSKFDEQEQKQAKDQATYLSDEQYQKNRDQQEIMEEEEEYSQEVEEQIQDKYQQKKTKKGKSKVKKDKEELDEDDEQIIDEETEQKEKEKQSYIDWIAKGVGQFLLGIGFPQFLVNIIQAIIYILLFLLWLAIEIAG